MGKIGVFDSGYGGLSILKAIRSELPEYDYLYLGDNARAPYGILDNGTIYKYTKQAVEYLFEHDCQLIILACNTASAVALRRLQQEYLPAHYPGRRILGVLIPAAEEVAARKISRVGVMATPATVASKAFTAEIQKMSVDTAVFEQACPKLVPMIEAHTSGVVLDEAIQEYVGYLLDEDIEAIILGCTHYELIKDNIEKNSPQMIRIISESELVVSSLIAYFDRHSNLQRKLSTTSTIKIITTGKKQNISIGVSQYCDDFMVDLDHEDVFQEVKL